MATNEVCARASTASIPEFSGYRGWSPVPNELLSRSGSLGGTTCLVYLALLFFAGRKREAWPSLATIANHVRLTTRAVRTALRTLERGGWIVRVDRAGTSNLWRITEPDSWGGT